MKFTLILFLGSCCLFCARVELPATTNHQSERTALQRPAKEPWQPGSYKGLTAGKSSKADMLEIFGKPKRVDFEDDPNTDQVWYVYDNVGEFPGEFTVAIDKRSGLVLLMFLQLESVSKEAVIERFGKDYVLTRYDFCPGFDDAESAPVYESEHGAPYLEYRSKGIAILIDDRGTVYSIEYLKEPVGYGSPRECQEVQAKRPAPSKRKS